MKNIKFDGSRSFDLGKTGAKVEKDKKKKIKKRRKLVDILC